MITPMYETLILFEDRGSLTLDQVSEIFGKKTRGVIGKMEAMSLIQRKGDRLNLSEKGHRLLNSVLDAIHKPTVHWDGLWRLVWYSIPESNRSKRDKFRRFMESLGMKPVLNSMWVSPNDIEAALMKEISLNGLKRNVIFIETKELQPIGVEEIIKSWNFDEYYKIYDDFIEKGEAKLKGGITSFEAKALIFEYAMILNNEPNLPIELLPRDWPKFRASLTYKKIRRRVRQ